MPITDTAATGTSDTSKTSNSAPLLPTVNTTHGTTNIAATGNVSNNENRTPNTNVAATTETSSGASESPTTGAASSSGDVPNVKDIDADGSVGNVEAKNEVKKGMLDFDCSSLHH
jgi:hypothetical protein